MQTTHGSRSPRPVSVGLDGNQIGGVEDRLRRRNPPSWVRQAERNRGLRGRAMTAEWQRIKELEREVRELRKANESL